MKEVYNHKSILIFFLGGNVVYAELISNWINLKIKSNTSVNIIKDFCFFTNLAGAHSIWKKIGLKAESWKRFSLLSVECFECSQFQQRFYLILSYKQFLVPLIAGILDP